MIFVLCYNRNNLIKYKENIKEALEEKIDKNKTVKTAHNLPYARMLFIDKEISKGEYPSVPKLAAKYEGVSVITIKRDID